MKGNVRKHCCLRVDIYVLNKTQRKTLSILKTAFYLELLWESADTKEKNKSEQMFKLTKV